MRCSSDDNRVHLVKDEKDACSPRFQATQVIELDFSDRRIGRQYKKRRVTFGQQLHGRFGVVLKRRADAGGIDDHRAVGKNAGGIKQLDPLNL